MTRPSLRIAFVGSGNMARLHLHALTRVGTPHTVVGVHDRNPAQAAAFAKLAGSQCRIFDSLDAMLAERPDVVHICTPAGTHFDPARRALLAGANVYVEKPLVETRREAEELFQAAHERRRIVCAGHQLMRDPGFTGLMGRAKGLLPAYLVDSYFTFRSPTLQLHRAGPRALAAQLLDILPHPLYTLLAAAEQCSPNASAGVVPTAAIVEVTASPVEISALLRVGEVAGRLFVSLRARPVASTLTVTGAGGSMTTDFVRAILVGAGNEGTGPLEKMLNPFIEARQIAWRTARSLVRRFTSGGHYPGLPELLDEFYHAVSNGTASPLSPAHLIQATAVYETIAARVRDAATAQEPTLARETTPSVSNRPIAVVTGAGGFFGTMIVGELARRGFRVRGLGRSERPTNPAIHEWVRGDLSQRLPPEALADADVVVHAAVETAGGFEGHQRNTIDATQNLIEAMTAAGVRRLVHVSSISVIRPPRTPWEVQHEATPLCPRPERLGPYTWGKVRAEELVAAATAAGRIESRIIRPAALVDFAHVDFPGLLGRRLFGRWHMGLGRPGLPLAVLDVRRAAAVVAWSAQRFADAPPVANLLDDRIISRRQLLDEFRAHGWNGRMVWVPIWFLSAAFSSARTLLALKSGRWPEPLAVYAVLRARRFDTKLSHTLFAAAEAAELQPRRAPALVASGGR